jgi:hypothetical protein
VYVSTFRASVATTLKPAVGLVLRSTSWDTSEWPASVHVRRIWLLDSAVAVRFVGAGSPDAAGRRRASPGIGHTARPSRRQARRICDRHGRRAPPSATQASISFRQLSRHSRAIEAPSAIGAIASTTIAAIHVARAAADAPPRG